MNLKRFTLTMLAATITALAQNLIPNPNFVDGIDDKGIPVGWTHDTQETVKNTMGVVLEDGRHCFRIQKLSTPSTPHLCRISAFPSKVVPGGDYVVSVDVKCAGTATDFIIYDFTPDGKYKSFGMTFDKKTHGWQTAYAAFKASPECKNLKLSLVARDESAPVFFTNVRFINVDEAPRAILHKLDVEPALDADWNAPVWEKADKTTPYYMLGKEYKTADATTSTLSKFAYGNGSLHIITLANEPTMADRITNESSWSNDTIELFLRDIPTGNTYHIGVTATGEPCADVVSTEQSAGFALDWHSAKTTTASVIEAKKLEFKSAISEQEKSWVAQFAIPLDQAQLKGRTQFQILMTRSRKTKKGEFNSSWGRTTTTFFKDSPGFATLALPSEGTLDKQPAIQAQPAPKPQALIVPTPQNAKFSKKVITLKAPLKLYSNNKKSFQAAKVMLETQLHTEIAHTAAEAEADIVLTLTDKPLWKEMQFNALADWQRAEAYTLATGKVTKATATTHRGLVYATASLAQLMTYDDNGNLAFLAGEIQDWPNMKYRGWHAMAPATSADMPDALRFIDTLAALKYNWYSIQIDSRFTYERNPNWGAKNAPTKDEHKQLAARIDLYGMDVIPMTQCLSHFSYFTARPEFRHMAEYQTPAPNARHKYWNYCPNHPEIHKYVFDMIEEHLECYPNAKWYHVGMDESTFEPIAVCERCKGLSGADFYADEVLRLHKFVTSKGLRMCMWCDQFEKERNGGKAPYNTVEGLPKIPRDIIIFDWHYTETTKFPSVKFFKDEGFEVMTCGWFFPDNVKPFIDETFKQNVLGYGGTTWIGISAIRQKFHMMTSVALCADRTWKQDDSSLDQLAYKPDQVFKRVFDGISPVRPLQFKTISLADKCNMSLAGASNSPWMGLDPDNDASSIPKGVNWFNGIPYHINEGTYSAIATEGSSQGFKSYPDSVWNIPVGGTVQELAFLHTATRPEKLQRHMYDRSNVKPKRLGAYIIHYADETTAHIPLQWENNIDHWNAQINSPNCQPAWNGKTKAGAVLTIETFRWTNPKPEVPIAYIDFISNKDKSAPVLLG
ncbi:MAG: family 20 glycosylhydrolase, partial [Victivallales bacterium]|nr:family 20 glycosylhydrolase [Victivallales bacterium]